MKIVQYEPTEEALERRDYRDYVRIKVDGEEEFFIGAGEPEDMYISRDLSDALNVVYMMEKAWEAGKRGEGLIVEYKTEDEY